jgi:hypothetical protein
MSAENPPTGGYPTHLVRVRTEPDGRFTAEAVGLPDITATAERREVAVQHVQAMLNQLLARGELVAVSVPFANPLLHLPKIDPNDPAEQEFLRFLEQRRREDLEERLRELDARCSDTSSTPTT